MTLIERATRERKAVSVGLLGNAAEVLPELLRRGVRPDAVTDQTSAHDPVNGYLPEGWTLERWDELRASDPRAVETAARRSMAKHVEAMLAFQKLGIPVFDYGNNIRQVALDEGVKDAFAFPGFVPAYVRPLFCRGVGPFRWAALSGNPKDIYRTDQQREGTDPGRSAPASLARHGAQPHPVPGTSRAHLLGRPRASGTGSAWRSTRWWRAASSRRRS